MGDSKFVQEQSNRDLFNVEDISFDFQSGQAKDDENCIHSFPI